MAMDCYMHGHCRSNLLCGPLKPIAVETGVRGGKAVLMYTPNQRYSVIVLLTIPELPIYVLNSSLASL